MSNRDEEPDERGLRPSDEVTMRLTISGLYPAERGNYRLPNGRLPRDDECAATDRAHYEDNHVGLLDMVSWFDDTSDVTVVIEPDTGGTAAERYQAKLRHAAKVIGVCDGGEYTNDWEQTGEHIRRIKQTLTDARAALRTALAERPDDPTALAMAEVLLHRSQG